LYGVVFVFISGEKLTLNKVGQLSSLLALGNETVLEVFIVCVCVIDGGGMQGPLTA
jgi:hypothetical protein